MRSARVCAVVAAVVVTLALAGCDGGGDDPTPHHTAKPPAKVALTLGVWGSDDEIASYQSVVDVYNTLSDESKVKIKAYPEEEDLVAAVEAGHAPDVYLINRPDLGALMDQKLTKPLGDLLDDRGVDFGDGYSRAALEAFSSDRDLQCMPWGISPMVMYYNRSLVNFDLMAAKGLDVPSSKLTGWSFDDFTAAADYAGRPRKGIAGVYVDPTLRGIAPFVYSGGGDLFDDDQDPTSLSFSSDGSVSALQTALPVLTDPGVNLTATQLAEKTPLQWFEDGKLGMIAGYRSWVPELRLHPELDWDVIGMPSINGSATVGDLSAFCISPKAEDVGAAADLLANLISTDSVRQITRAGYLAPANSTVAVSDDFLQAGRAPTHASVFNSAVRAIRVLPILPDYAALDTAESPLLKQLLETGGAPDLATLTQSIDDTSRAILSPPTETPSPTESPFTTESPSTTGSPAPTAASSSP